MQSFEAENMAMIAEQAVIEEVKRRVRAKIEESINPIIDAAVEQICKDLSGKAVIERDARTMQDFLALVVSNKKSNNQSD